MRDSISSINKVFNNLKNGKCRLLDSTENKILAEFDGEIQESNCTLYVVQNGKLYCIVLNENGEYCLEKY